jgi:signal transduction histidine kinase
MKTLRPASLISAVRTAISPRHRQYENRDHLHERKQTEDAVRRACDALESVVEQRTAFLRRLSVRLLRLQDDERRRIARELHDGLGQYLIAAKINLDMLARLDGDSGICLREAQHLIEHAIADTRTLSHLLHPPLLDEAGFASAARWYVEDFAKRSGIVATLDIPEKLQRLPAEVETALFRILQEALTNVHRHSRSSSVKVRLDGDPSCVALAIQDHGRGISQDSLQRFRQSRPNLGLGLAGMRERVREFGGTLHLESSSAGTLLTAMMPVARAEKPQPARGAVSTAAIPPGVSSPARYDDLSDAGARFLPDFGRSGN